MGGRLVRMFPPLPLAFLGASQETLGQIPCEWLDLFTRMAAFMARQGRSLHMGATPGCEQLAAEAALGAGGTVHLFLPWAKYEAAWIKPMMAEHGERIRLTEYARDLHPKWDAYGGKYHGSSRSLGPKGRKLISRIGGVIEGCAGVVALPPHNEERTGGTVYGIGLAKVLGIEVWNLREPYTRDWWTWRLECRAMTREEFETYLAHQDPSQYAPGVLEQAWRLAAMTPEDTGPRRVSPYDSPIGRLLSVMWRGHRCSLDVIVYPDTYQTRPDFPEDGVSDPRASWMFAGVAPQLAYIRDSITAGSLGLSVAEWRAITEPTSP